MPVRVCTTVPVTEVRRGDLIVGHHGDTPVVKVERKSKFTYLHLENGTKPVRVESTASIDVRRLEATPEEKAAAELGFRLRSIDHAMQSAERSMAEIRTKMAEKLSVGNVLTHWDFGELASAQAVAKVWDRVTYLHLNATLFKLQNGDEPVTILEVVQSVREEYERELIEFASYTSRSTSAMSNVIDDYEREAKARFLRDLRWVI